MPRRLLLLSLICLTTVVWAVVVSYGQFGRSPVPPAAQVTVVVANAAPGTEPMVNSPHLVLTQAEFVPFSGRVLDISGHPMSGVVVVAKIVTRDGTKTYPSATTGEDGRFAFSDVPSLGTMTIRDLKFRGFEPQSFGSSVDGPGGVSFADSVMIPRNATYTGQILDKDEQPAGGAWVVAYRADKPHIGGDFMPRLLKAGVDGRFQLNQMPGAGLILLAAHGFDFGQGTAEVGIDAKVTLTAPEPLSSEAKAAFIASINPDDYRNLLDFRDVIGAKNLLELALRADGAISPDGSHHDEKAGNCFASWLAYAAWNDPEVTADLAPAALARYNPTHEFDFDMEEVAADCAGHPNPDAVTYANAWIEHHRAFRPGSAPNEDNSGVLLSVGALATALHRADAGELMDAALREVHKSGSLAAENYSAAWGGELAAAGEPALERLDVQLHRDDGHLAASECETMWSAATCYLARDDLPAAEHSAAIVEKLATDPDVAAWDAQAAKAAGIKDSKPHPRLVGQPRLAAVHRALMWAEATAGSPKAMTEAAFFPGNGTMPVYGLLVQKAHAKGDDVTARAALKIGITEMNGANGWHAFEQWYGYFSWLAQPFDSDLAKDLLTQMPDGPGPGPFNPQNCMADYCFYQGFTDPALSRVLLEANLLQFTTPGGMDIVNADGTTDPTGDQRLMIADALFPLAPARALRILAESPDTTGYRPTARARMIATTESDPSQWPLLPVA